MSHLMLEPGFDFQQAGKEVLHIERQGLEQLDQYINEDFTCACERIFTAGKSGGNGHGQIGTYW